MSQSERPRTPRLFIASTADDLQPHRDEVAKALEGLEVLSLRMENGGARPGPTVEECVECVRRSDGLIVIVAHRYGWIPSMGQGGDDRKSITRIETEAARRHGKPVLAFLVDETAAWSQKKEQDRLLELGSSVSAEEVMRSVQALAAFKKELAKSPYARFTTPEDLAKSVVQSVARLFKGASLPRNFDQAREPTIQFRSENSTFGNVVIGENVRTGRLSSSLAKPKKRGN